MAKFVMMSMVFTVVLLKSSAIGWAVIPKVIPKAVQVGDGIGWAVPKVTAFYKNWAAKKKFYVGERLTFKFASNSNVKRVTEAAYEACDKLNAIENVTDLATGPANVTLNSAGMYYFICSIANHCQLGMKLAISVLDSPPPTPPVSSSPAVSVGVLVPMMAVVMGFFF